MQLHPICRELEEVVSATLKPLREVGRALKDPFNVKRQQRRIEEEKSASEAERRAAKKLLETERAEDVAEGRTIAGGTVQLGGTKKKAKGFGASESLGLTKGDTGVQL